MNRRWNGRTSGTLRTGGGDLYALALDEAATVLPADKNYTRQLKAAAILEKVLAAQPTILVPCII